MAIITYKGAQIAEADANTKTLLTAGKYCEGNILITDTPFELVNTLYDHTFNLSTDTTFDSWTASTTAKAILATANVGTFVADMLNYEYLLWWSVATKVAHTQGATLKATLDWEGAELIQSVFRRANSLANIAAGNAAGNATVQNTTAPLNIYYNTGGTKTYTYSIAYGIYPAITSPTFSNATSAAPTVTVKRPTLNARCNASYFATARKAEVDSANTETRMVCKLYRMRRTRFGSSQAYDELYNTYNNLL